MLAPGFDCSDIQGTEALMNQSQDWVQFVLDLPMVDDPGEKWTYCSSAVHLVSAVLQSATGMDARTFANQYLFEPIGIAEVPAERWPSDPAGISTGGNGLMLTPGELSRFAYLYLNGGRWGDRQVVPAEWVAASTTPNIEVGKMKEYGDMNRSYGYLWSLYPEQKFYSALGRNGQHIHVFPEENMLVIFTSATPVASDERQFTLLKDYILPAVRSKTALPENPAAFEKLEALLADAAMPRRPVADLPPSGQKVNGKSIRIPDSSVGWETVTFTFKDGENTADLLFNTGEHLSVGLDNLYRLQDLPGEAKQGFRGTWDSEGRFILEQLILGTWLELEVSMKIEGDQVTFFQRNPVDGGNLIRFKGVIEE
jgi:hypothetical protein